VQAEATERNIAVRKLGQDAVSLDAVLAETARDGATRLKPFGKTLTDANSRCQGEDRLEAKLPSSLVLFLCCRAKRSRMDIQPSRPRHCDFEARLPGGRHEGIRRRLFRRSLSETSGIFLSNSPGRKISEISRLRVLPTKGDVQDTMFGHLPVFALP
jgi:hypothetical protein